MNKEDKVKHATYGVGTLKMYDVFNMSLVEFAVGMLWVKTSELVKL